MEKSPIMSVYVESWGNFYCRDFVVVVVVVVVVVFVVVIVVSLDLNC